MRFSRAKALLAIFCLLICKVSFSQIPDLSSAQYAALGVEGYWPFEGDANDVSGNGLDGTPSSVSLVSGRLGQAFDFGGVGKIETMATQLSLGETYTVAAWLKLTDYGPNQAIISYAIPVTGNPVFLLMFDPSPSLRLQLRAAGVSPTILELSPPFPSGEWYHVAAVVNNGIRTIYLNGSSVAEGAYTNSHPDITGIICIGCDAEGDQFFFSGQLDDVVITRAQDLTDFLRDHPSGSKIAITVVRDARFLVTFDATLTDRPES